MPSTSEVGSVVRASVLNLDRAGEPLGEPAPAPGILGAMGDDLRSKLPDELVDVLVSRREQRGGDRWPGRVA
jgi:hypothetical protein